MYNYNTYYLKSEIIDGETQTIRDISLPEVLNNYIVEPQTPSRVFA